MDGDSIMEKSGFYLYEAGNLFYAENAVMAPTFTLVKEEKDTYEYPIHDWIWFDSEEEAKAHFNIINEENNG